MTTTLQPAGGATGSAPTGGSAVPGDAPLGRVSIAERAVEKIAARAAGEVPDVYGAAGGLLDRLRGADTADRPDVSADVDGALAYLELTLGVRWPASVACVTGQVRDRVRDRVHAMTGLQVVEVRVHVTALVVPDAPPRVQ